MTAVKRFVLEVFCWRICPTVEVTACSFDVFLASAPCTIQRSMVSAFDHHAAIGGQRQADSKKMLTSD